MSKLTMNLRGLKCPLPALRTRRALSAMAAGEVLVIECTDPLTSIDIPNLLRETGDALEASEKKGKVLIFRIRKHASAAGLHERPKKPTSKEPARRKR